jgi:hypothetical protein
LQRMALMAQRMRLKSVNAAATARWALRLSVVITRLHDCIEI